ncbi:MAG: hypothetical protein LBG19_09200 [Prevotellaceae bacterium]|nr:hypothetical protein [Prevotellaceae bacterium]
MIASLVLFGACQSNPGKKSNEPEPLEKVVKIEYQHYGGMGWLSEILSITQDSISYSFSPYIQKESRHYGIAADASV